MITEGSSLVNESLEDQDGGRIFDFVRFVTPFWRDKDANTELERGPGRPRNTAVQMVSRSAADGLNRMDRRSESGEVRQRTTGPLATPLANPEIAAVSVRARATSDGVRGH